MKPGVLIIYVPVAALLLFVLVNKIYVIRTPSMAAAIVPGNHVLVLKKQFWAKNYQTGDILAFKNDDVTLVKRVAAVGGDTIFTSADHENLLIHGRPVPPDPVLYTLSEEETDKNGYGRSEKLLLRYDKYYEFLLNMTNRRMLFFENRYSTREYMIIPEDHYFMIGDNLYKSMDSRFWGLTHKDEVIGKVWLIL